MTEERRTTAGATEPGVVEEVLPKALYRVRLDSGPTVRANAHSSLRHAVVRLLIGDRVLVELSRHDPSRGRITKKL